MTETEYLKKQKDLIDSGYAEVDELQYLLTQKNKSHDGLQIYDHINKIHFFVKEKKKKVVVPDPNVDPIVDPNTGKKGCMYSSTPFTNTTEGNDFRKWVRENFNDYAISINLSSTGEFNNCNYIRKAYANVIDGYALSLGEIYLKIKKNSNLQISDFKKDNYQKTKERETIEQIYTTDSKMWQDLIDKGELTKYGQIQKLSGGIAVYVLKYVKGTDNVVKDPGFMDFSVDTIKPDLEKYDFVVLLPPPDRNKKPLKGQIGLIKIKPDVNGEDSVRIVKEKGSYWTAFQDEMKFSVNESIIQNILGLLGENIVRNSDGEQDVAIVGNITRNPDNKVTTDDKKVEEKKTEVCVLTPQQKKDLDSFIEMNKDTYQAMESSQDPLTKNYLLSAYTDTTKILNSSEHTVVLMKDLPKKENGKEMIYQSTTLSPSCIVYQRTNIVNKQPDQVKALEKFFSAATLNLTTTAPEIGGLPLNFKIFDLIPLKYIQDNYKKDFKLDDQNVKVWLKNYQQVNTTRESCRTSVKTLAACIDPNRKGGGRVCNDLPKIVDYKLDAYFCDQMSKGEKSYKGDEEVGGFFKGQGRYWSRIGLGNEIDLIRNNAQFQNSIYSIKNMYTANSLYENISSKLELAITEKIDMELSQRIKNNLMSRLK